MTALELSVKLDELNNNKASVDKKIAALKEMALEVEMEKGKYDEQIQIFLKELTGTDAGEVHLTEIIQKVMTLK